MKHLTEKELLSELRRRITAALKERQEVKITSDGIIINNSHTMHFEIRSKDFYFKGQIIKRADGECGHPTAIHNKDGCNAIFPQCGCTTPTDLKPAEMPLISEPRTNSEDYDEGIRHGSRYQRDVDMAWLPTHDQQVASKAVKEFGSNLIAHLPAIHSEIRDCCSNQLREHIKTYIEKRLTNDIP